MIFKNLKEKCNYYRDLTDYKVGLIEENIERKGKRF